MIEGVGSVFDTGFASENGGSRVTLHPDDEIFVHGFWFTRRHEGLGTLDDAFAAFLESGGSEIDKQAEREIQQAEVGEDLLGMDGGKVFRRTSAPPKQCLRLSSLHGIPPQR